MSKHAHAETHQFHRGVYPGGGVIILLLKKEIKRALISA